MLEFTTDNPTGGSALEISFDEVGAKQLIRLIEDCFRTGHEHLLPLGDDSRWSLTITGPNSYQTVTLYLEESSQQQDLL
jgi:hypothetical protein